MIDPVYITDFNASDEKLEELLLFWIAVAGKNALTISKALNSILTYGRKCSRRKSPFKIINWIDQKSNLAETLKEFGIGCYNLKARSYRELIKADFDLQTVSAQELETIPGIGMKTSRCFIMHTRKNARYAGLDVHILKWMSDKGFDVPKNTPTGKKYLEIEKQFLKLYEQEAGNVSVADFDLQIWRKYSGKL